MIRPLQALGLLSAGVLAVALFSSAATEQPPAPGPVGLTFTDHRGRAVSERNFAGQFQLVFFGYTHCPDVCPTSLELMSAALRRMGDGAEEIRPVFITLDPDRDTPEVLRDFVRHFHPRLVGLTGTQAQIDAAARAYDVEYLYVAAAGVPGGYSISHGGDLHLVGPDGRGVAVLDHRSGVDGLVRELRRYVKPQLRGDAKGAASW